MMIYSTNINEEQVKDGCIAIKISVNFGDEEKSEANKTGNQRDTPPNNGSCNLNSRRKININFKSKMKSSFARLNFFQARILLYLKPPPLLPPPPLSTNEVFRVLGDEKNSTQSIHTYNFANSIKQPISLIIKSKLERVNRDNHDEDSKKKKNGRDQNLRKLASNSEDEDKIKEKDIDSGYAWIILAVMFLINSSTFGTARAYGLIFEKLAREDEHSRSEAAFPFTMMGAIENMGGPLTGYLLTRTHSWRFTVMLGSCLITIAHLLTAFCLDSQIGQVLSMGLMCGLGLSLVSISFFQINNAYFVRYRNRAFGLGLTGAVFGTFYISPLCQYVLNKYSTKYCYLLLTLILFPNVPLSLLLKPKRIPTIDIDKKEKEICSISRKVDQKLHFEKSISRSTILVIKNPAFHLIWPTQILFCWFNFVFGMIIVDFGVDRGLSSVQVSHLIPIWAIGQLVGRIVLGLFVDLKFISHQYFTVVCFAVISLATYILNNVHSEDYENILISTLVFILSVFISNLYILFNGLIIKYMDKSMTALSIGISSFIGSFFLLPRAYIIGHYRDTFGNYDAMLTLFTYCSFVAALVWLLMPALCFRIYSFITVMRTSTQTGLMIKC